MLSHQCERFSQGGSTHTESKAFLFLETSCGLGGLVPRRVAHPCFCTLFPLREVGAPSLPPGLRQGWASMYLCLTVLLLILVLARSIPTRSLLCLDCRWRSGGNWTRANLRAWPPVRALRDCGACILVFRLSSPQSIR